MPPCMPVTWKNGSTARPHSSWYVRCHWDAATVLNMTLRWRWRQPLGLPVVPEVYGITHRSSAVARCGPGLAPAVSASLHDVTLAADSDSRGARIHGGTSRSVGAV